MLMRLSRTLFSLDLGNMEAGGEKHNARSARTRSSTAKPTIIGDSSGGDIEEFKLNPIVPQALKQSKDVDISRRGEPPTKVAKTIPSHSPSQDNKTATPETPGLAVAKVRELVMSFQGKTSWSRPMRL